MKTNNQQNFINAHRKKHHLITFLRFCILVLFLSLWEISARLHWIDTFFFSSPGGILTCFLSLIKNHTLLLHTGTTLYETMVSFFFVLLLSFICALLLWFFPTFAKCTEPFLVALNSLPKSALAPLILVWLGTGRNTIIITGISVALFGSIISFQTAFQECENDKLILIKTLGGNKIQEFQYVVFPSALPTLLSTAKVDIGLTLVGVIIGEFLAAKQGLGYLIIYGSQVFKLNLVITSIMILCIMSVLLYQVMEIIIHSYKKRAS